MAILKSPQFLHFHRLTKPVSFLWAVPLSVFIHNTGLSSANLYEGDVCHHRVTWPVCGVILPTPPTLGSTWSALQTSAEAAEGHDRGAWPASVALSWDVREGRMSPGCVCRRQRPTTLTEAEPPAPSGQPERGEGAQRGRSTANTPPRQRLLLASARAVCRSLRMATRQGDRLTPPFPSCQWRQFPRRHSGRARAGCSEGEWWPSPAPWGSRAFSFSV